MKNNILAQTTKPELSQYLHEELLISATEILLKSIKQGLLKTWRGITENIINEHLEKPKNIKMGNLQMIRQGLQSTR